MKYYLKAFEKYITFSGRARRSEYWYFFLFNVLISLGLRYVDKMMQTTSIEIFYSLAAIPAGFSLAVRRMHNVGKSGWFVFIPIYNLILVCTEGEKESNEYGADPKENG